MVEESLRIKILEYIPSPEEFTSAIEPTNVPAVIRGCVKNWRAFSLWNPFHGGLHYLMASVGSSIVEAMLSKSAPVFYGDIRSHERVQLPFSTFIGYCNKLVQNSGKEFGASFESERHSLVPFNNEQVLMAIGEEAPEQIYLAQVPILNFDEQEKVQLGPLREDIQTPRLLETKKLASINLWMSSSHTRSSTHYDPHHNLLCIVAGRKQVVLWPPSASPLLYPMSLYGEASNHSAVTLESPDLSIHPRATHLMEYSQTVVLNAGDALFIPEGWFHQVDSDDLTIAINFWWQSDLTYVISEHMDAYYVRLLLRRLTDKQMNLVLHKSISGAERSESHVVEQVGDGKAGNSEHSFGLKCEERGAKGNKLKEKLLLHDLEPQPLKALHELVSLVHSHVNSASADKEKAEHVNFVKDNLFCLEDDPVALILWNLHPLSLRSVLIAMAHNFPRTLEALILHLLSPVGAEVLTRKFDEIDKLTSEEDQKKLYEVLYGSFDDQFTAMDAILSRKESFAHQAFKNVLDQYLGVNFEEPTPSV